MVEQLVECIRNKDQQTEQQEQSQACLQTVESRQMKTECQRAMSQLYQMYVEELSSVCYRYVPMESDAKDVLQNSFIKIFTSLSTFEYRDELSFVAWMKKVVVNEAIKFLKERKKLSFVNQDVNQLQISEEEPEVERITADELHQLISELPDGYRTVINLFVFEDYSHREIAEMLGIKENTSASQLYHAKRLLARTIKEFIIKKR